MANSDGSPMPQGARNFFFYFLNFALLYTVAINLGGVLFNIIKRSFPLVGIYDSFSSLSFNLASLIIGSPIFFWLAWKIFREEKKSDIMVRSGIRRWLTYITLIVTALVVIGDLIALVNSLIRFETTTRFILQALVVLGISGTIFSYYLVNIRQERGEVPKKTVRPRAYFLSGIGIICIVIVSGFFYIEPPATQRLRLQDDTRLNNLMQLESSINQFASVHSAKLPTSLADLVLSEGAANDPVTGQTYTYEVVDATNFKLCANFETSNRERTGESMPYPDGSWLHDKGVWCFERSVNQYLKGVGVPVKPAPIAP